MKDLSDKANQARIAREKIEQEIFNETDFKSIDPVLRSKLVSSFQGTKGTIKTHQEYYKYLMDENYGHTERAFVEYGIFMVRRLNEKDEIIKTLWRLLKGSRKRNAGRKRVIGEIDQQNLIVQIFIAQLGINEKSTYGQFTKYTNHTPPFSSKQFYRILKRIKNSVS